MKHLYLLLSLITVTLASTICDYTTPDGYQYNNLINLRIKETSNKTEYYNGVNQAEQYQMYVNICGNTNVGCNPVSASCLQDAFNNYFSCGLLSSLNFTQYVNETTGKIQSDKGLVLHYYNGQQCYSNSSLPTHTKIVLTCDPSVQTFSTPLFTEPIPCQFHVRFSSRWACPSGHVNTRKINTEFLIFILIVFAIVLYFIIHSIINIAYFKKSGFEIIPFSFVCFKCCPKQIKQKDYNEIN